LPSWIRLGALGLCVPRADRGQSGVDGPPPRQGRPFAGRPQLGEHPVEGTPGEADLEQGLHHFFPSPSGGAPSPSPRSRPLERFADGRARAVLVVAGLLVDGGSGHVPQADLALAQSATDDAELAGGDGGRHNRTQSVSLAVLDALREFDLALAGEERHARELLEVRGDRVGGGVAAGRMNGKGSAHYRRWGITGQMAFRSTLRRAKRLAYVDCFPRAELRSELGRRSGRSAAGSRCGLGPFDHLSVKESFLQGTEMVDHQDALQVFVFMLDCDG